MPVTSRNRFLLFAAGVLFASTTAAGQAPAADPLVKEGTTVKLAGHTHVIPDANVSLVPNVGIVVGSRATLVIDPGLGKRNGEAVLREVAKVSRNAEIYIASTHFHAEHTTGYLAFPASAKYVNSKVQEAEFAQGAAQQIQNFSARSPMTAELLRGATGRPADITFDRDYTLDLGGVRVRFLVVGPTHTRGDTGLFVEGDDVLFSGDVVMNQSFLAAGQVTSMKAWLAAFDAFETMRPRIIVPAHGAVGDGSIIAVNRGIMQGVQARARELKAQGRSADETAAAVQTEFQAQHPGWPRANGLAAAARAAYAEAPDGAVPAAGPGAAPQVATPTDVQPGSINNEDITYPYPVSYLPFVSYGQDVRMAYMDVPPASQPNGRTVVLLHGMNFAGFYWAGPIEALRTAGFRVVVTDQIGFGRSSKPIIPYNFHDMALNTKRVLDHLGIAKASIVGHSMGGMLAARFAASYPDVAERVVLYSPIGVTDARWERPYRSTDEAYKATLGYTYQQAYATIRRYFPTPAAWKPEYEKLARQHYAWTLSGEWPRMAMIRALLQQQVYVDPVVYDWPHIKSKALIMGGTIDGANFPEAARHIADTIPGAQLFLEQGAGHVLHYERPEIFNRELLKFLTS